mmetsp:Transcript_11155/g.12276  ORF Transcript_11155/g.12276 Transcript_11155/m.12276 type:complete len:174 (+) Transcript_11155:1-522(+)
MQYNGDGLCSETKLSPLVVSLQDLFLPVNTSPHIRPKQRFEYMNQLFDKLWGDIATASEVRSAPDKPPMQVLSVKYVEVKAEVVTSCLLSNFGDFLVEPLEDVKKALEEKKDAKQEDAKVPVKVLICLPRRFHLLLKCYVSEKGILTEIATDYWRILAYIDALLDDLYNKTPK